MVNQPTSTDLVVPGTALPGQRHCFNGACVGDFN